MFGIRYVKVPVTTHVLQFKEGKVVREGSGLSFFCFGPTSVLVYVPIGTIDVPFVFNEVTADFQDATIQGELTYRIRDPRRIAQLMDYSVDAFGRFRSDDPEKLNDRLVHVAQTLARTFTQARELGDLLGSSEPMVAELLPKLRASETVEMLGVEVLGLSVLSIKPTPEMSKALQAQAREELLRKADEAIYARRNAAVEMERQIKENELNTEIAVEQKRRQVRETQMAADVAVEEQRSALVDRRVANEGKTAEARGAALRVTLDPLKGVDWRTLMAASAGGVDSKLLMAMAFRDLADNAHKIGTLNISPELLQALMDEKRGSK
jgi:regulator of protease activity HflC (stomatin/prohibitin superfamily)